MLEYQNYQDIKRLRFILNAIERNIYKKSPTILDVGCGNGIISMNLAAKGFEVTGIDISNKAIKKASQLNNYPNLKFKIADAEKLAIEERQYDIVICSEVLEHLNDPENLLKSIYKLLTENGILIATVPNGYGPREVFVTKPTQKIRLNGGKTWRLIKNLKQGLGYTGTTIQSDADHLSHVQFFTQTRLNKLAEKTGFVIHKIGKSNFVDDVFPFSFIAKRIRWFQKMDCFVADFLPLVMTGGFNMIWTKR
jgi:ubiquinone/menaquinone biosynthesis C-methylase UbiE